MALIEQRDAVDVFVNAGGTITISNPQIFNHAENAYEDILVTIHPEYVDTVIDALKRAKKEIEDAREEELNN